MTCYDMFGGKVSEVIVYNLLMEVFVCILREILVLCIMRLSQNA